MDVFVSWSGSRSELVAKALCDWIPLVLQAAKPWMSRQIEKGSRWDDVVSEKLETSSFGIVCLTPENLSSDWVLFESGALSKKARESRVCTYLYGVTEADISGPLSRFQHTRADREDTLRLITTINSHLGSTSLEPLRLSATYDRWWPHLEKRLSVVPAVEQSRQPKRDVLDKIDEILVEVRAMSRVNTGESLETTFQRQHAAWREFRSAIAREASSRKELQAFEEREGSLWASEVAHRFDISASVGDRRVGVDVHVAAQIVDGRVFPEFASGHALHFAQSLRNGGYDLICVALDQNLTDEEPIHNLIMLAKELGIAPKVHVISGKPDEIAQALVRLGQSNG